MSLYLNWTQPVTQKVRDGRKGDHNVKLYTMEDRGVGLQDSSQGGGGKNFLEQNQLEIRNKTN